MSTKRKRTTATEEGDQAPVVAKKPRARAKPAKSAPVVDISEAPPASDAVGAAAIETGDAIADTGAGAGAGADTGAVAMESTKAGNKRNLSMVRYLQQLFEAAHTGRKVSKPVFCLVEHDINQTIKALLLTIKNHLESAKRRTLKLADVDICLRRHPELKRMPDLEESIAAAVASYEATKAAPASKEEQEGGEKKKVLLWAKRAGLCIPPSRVRRQTQRFLDGYQLSPVSITALSAVYERAATYIFAAAIERTPEGDLDFEAFVDCEA